MKSKMDRTVRVSRPNGNQTEPVIYSTALQKMTELGGLFEVFPENERPFLLSFPVAKKKFPRGIDGRIIYIIRDYKETILPPFNFSA